MGATHARDADARLSLAVPVHTTIGRRRVLDPKSSNCAVCRLRFIPLIRGKHYCRRCGDIVCEACTSLRTYGDRLPSHASQQQFPASSPPPPEDNANNDGGSSNGRGSAPGGSPTSGGKGGSSSGGQKMPIKFRVCTPCNLRRSAVVVLPQSCWERILTFAGDAAHHNVLQTCRRLQLVANLPYPHGSGWDTFFGESTFIAKGANGAVYRAQLHGHVAQRLGLRGAPTVAVKVVNKATVLSLRKWRHVIREVDAMTACRHPNVLRLLGVFQSPDAVFLVLEYAPGGDVFDWLVSKRGCTESEGRGIMRQLLVALQHMHDNCGAVHRDVKPENLFLLEKATPSSGGSRSIVRGSVPPMVLGDFGYARVFPESANPRRPPLAGAGAAMMPVAAKESQRLEAMNREVTAKATPCGTLGFAPPEVLQAYADRKAQPSHAPAAPITPVDVMKKTDVFAAGVTMCLLLTATEPFPCHSSAANVAAVQRGVDFSGRQWSHVSAPARALITKMLAPRAEDRPSAYDCLASPWFTAGGGRDAMALPRPGGERIGDGGPAAAAAPDVVTNAARSLRKNQGGSYRAPVGLIGAFVAANNASNAALMPPDVRTPGVTPPVTPEGGPVLRLTTRDELEREDRALDRHLKRHSEQQQRQQQQQQHPQRGTAINYDETPGTPPRSPSAWAARNAAGNGGESPSYAPLRTPGGRSATGPNDVELDGFE